MQTSPHIIPGITQVAAQFRGVLLDAFGVFWGGNDFGVIPGAKEAMATLVGQGNIVGVLSNATQRAAKEIDKLKLHGLILGTHFHFYVTSGEVAKSLFMYQKLPFATPRNTFFLFGGVHPKYYGTHVALFEDTVYRETPDIDTADFIYLSVPHIDGKDQEDPEAFRIPLEKIRSKKLIMVCANPDQFAHEGNPPRQVVRQGTLAKMYEEMGGPVFYIGKPYPAVYHAAMREFQRYDIGKPADILMVGDNPVTDIRGAREFGMSSALITETGIMADTIHLHGLHQAIIDLEPSDKPDYFIGKFHVTS